MSPLDDPSPRSIPWDLLPLRLVLSPSWYVRRVSPLVDQLPDVREIVSFVHADVLRRLPGRLWPLNRHALQGKLHEPFVVRVRAADGYADGYPLALYEKTPLRAGFRPVGRIRTGLFPPKGAFVIAPSIDCHSQSIPFFMSYSRSPSFQSLSKKPASPHS